MVARVAVEQAAARRGGPDAPLAALARRMAAVLLARGTPAEAQQLSELAATLAATPEEAGRDLDEAAGAAELRGAGDTAQELRRASADAFAAGGSPAAAAEQLARAAEALNRTPGHLLTFPAEGAAEALTDAARALAGDDPRASSRILTAMVFADLGRDPDGQAREAVALARRAGDVAGESAALDAQGSRAMDRGDLRAAYAIQIRRIALLETAPATASVALEYQDALQTAADFALALGELDSALRFAQAIGALAGLAAERHLAVAPLLLAHVLRGELRSALALTDVFLASWTRAGRPVIGALSAAAYAAATAFALSGDDEQAASWRAIAVEVFGARERLIDFERAFFDVLVLLHRQDAAGALERAWSPPETRGTVPIARWVAASWRPWYAVLRAEAAVLAGAPDASARVAEAPQHLGGNPVAEAVLQRAAALLTGEAAALPAIARRLDGLGAPYQAARTRLLAGGAEAARGAAELDACGAVPMGRVPSARAVVAAEQDHRS